MASESDYIRPDAKTSIFDPVVCELAYRWWTAPGDMIFDPFAGGSVRGVVAAMLGRWYTGIELRAEQVDSNREQAAEICDTPMPTWVVGDSDEMDELVPDLECDFVFTCPPYHDLEVYSDDPADISGMDWDEFQTVYTRIIGRAAQRLRNDRFMAVVIGDVRDKNGIYRGLPQLTVKAMEDAGLQLYQDAILADPTGTLRFIAPRVMKASRKLTHVHQYLFVTVKGSPKRAAQRLRDTGDFQ